MSMQVTGIHPLTELWPIFDDVLEELTESIRENGLRFPITITPDGLVIDGRTRLKACEMVGVEPEFRVYDGDDIRAFIADANGERRHMSQGAVALVNAEMMVKENPEAREGGRWAHQTLQEKMGKSAHLSRRRFVDAGVILDYAPHLIEEVKWGRISFNAAYQEANAAKQSVEAEKIAARNKAKAEREAEQAEAERQQRLLAELQQAQAIQYLNYIDSGEMSIPSAHAAWMEATRREREHQRQIDNSRRGSLRAIWDATARLTSSKYAEILLKEAYPYEADLMETSQHMTRARTQNAIEFLTTLQKGLNK